MASHTAPRTLLFTMKVAGPERAQIHAAAQARGISAAEMVRQGLHLQGALPNA